MSAQASLLSIAHQKKLRCEKFLNEMETVMPWKQMLESITPFYTEKDVGRKHKELMVMLKIHLIHMMAILLFSMILLAL